jgi:hypothetical protein
MAACDLTVLIADAAQINQLSETEKLAARVYFLAEAVKGSSGTDLTNINTLREAVVQYNIEPDARRSSFATVAAQSAAVNSTGLASAPTIGDLRAAIKNLVLVPAKELRAAETLLNCQLLTLVVP